MPLYTFLLKPFAQTTEADTSSLPDHRRSVIEASVDERPKAIHMGSNEFATPLHSDAKRHHGRFTIVGIRRPHEPLYELKKRWEDLVRGESGGEGIDDAKSDSRW